VGSRGGQAEPRLFTWSEWRSSMLIMKSALDLGMIGVPAYLPGPKPRSTCKVKAAGWLKGLEAAAQSG
jgi:hypothetical protein